MVATLALLLAQAISVSGSGAGGLATQATATPGNVSAVPTPGNIGITGNFTGSSAFLSGNVVAGGVLNGAQVLSQNNVVGPLGTSIGLGNVAPVAGLHAFGGGRFQKIADPAAPMVVVFGTAGAITYSYYVVGVDAYGNRTAPSPAGTVTTSVALASLSQFGTFNAIQWLPMPGAVKYEVYRTGQGGGAFSTALLLQVILPPATGFYDYNQYVPVTPSGTPRSSTGSLYVDSYVSTPSIVGPTTVSGIPALVAPTVVNTNAGAGATTYTYFYDCDDIYGNRMPPSPSGSVAGAAASLFSYAYITISITQQPGCTTYHLLKGNTATLLATIPAALFSGPVLNYNDVGAATTGGYVPGTRNVTSDYTVNGNLTAASNLRTGNASNTDLSGKVTLAAGSGSYTFTGTYATAPVCLAQDDTTPANQVTRTVTTTTLTVAAAGATDVISYICVGRN